MVRVMNGMLGNVALVRCYSTNREVSCRKGIVIECGVLLGGTGDDNAVVYVCGAK
jgi:hypothetical protein